MLGYFEIRIMKLLGSSTPTKYQLPTCIGLINIHIPKLFYSKPRKSLTLSLFLFGSGRDTSLKKWVLMEALELCPWLEFLFCFFFFFFHLMWSLSFFFFFFFFFDLCELWSKSKTHTGRIFTHRNDWNAPKLVGFWPEVEQRVFWFWIVYRYEKFCLLWLEWNGIHNIEWENKTEQSFCIINNNYCHKIWKNKTVCLFRPFKNRLV